MQQLINRQQTPLFRIMVGFLLGMVLLWLAGCSNKYDSVPRNIEADYGRSVTNNRLEMMVTPPNAVDPSPPVGMTPQAAANSQTRYEQTFSEKKESTSTLVLTPK